MVSGAGRIEVAGSGDLIQGNLIGTEATGSISTGNHADGMTCGVCSTGWAARVRGRGRGARGDRPQLRDGHRPYPRRSPPVRRAGGESWNSDRCWPSRVRRPRPTRVIVSSRGGAPRVVYRTAHPPERAGCPSTPLETFPCSHEIHPREPGAVPPPSGRPSNGRWEGPAPGRGVRVGCAHSARRPVPPGSNCRTLPDSNRSPWCTILEWETVCVRA